MEIVAGHYEAPGPTDGIWDLRTTANGVEDNAIEFHDITNASAITLLVFRFFQYSELLKSKHNSVVQVKIWPH